MSFCAVALALFAPLTLGAPSQTDTPIAQPAANGQTASAIAMGASSQGLAVWQDARFGPIAIAGARFDFATKNILDTRGFVIAPAGMEPAVAFDGTSYLVVYRAFGGADNNDIVARRVSTDGTLLDAVPLVVDASAGNQANPQVASDGSHFMIVWEDTVGGSRIRARVMDSDGTFGAVGPVDVSTGALANGKYKPAVAASDSGFLIAWQELRTQGNAYDVFARALTAAGTLGTELAVSATTFDETQPSVAWNGSTFLIAMTSTTSTLGKDIIARRATAAGGATGNTFAVTAIAQDQTSSSVTGQSGGSTNFLVTFVDETSGTTFDVRGSRVTSAGSMVDPPINGGFAIATGAMSLESEPAACPLPTGDFAVVFTERATDITVGVDIWLRDISDTNGAPGTISTVLSESVNAQQRPSVAHGANGYLLAWEDNRAKPVSNLWGLRLDAAGMAIGAPFELQSAPTYALDMPRVAYAGGIYDVVWETGGSVLWQRFAESDGSPVADVSMLVSGGGMTSASGARVASNGTDILLTYTWSSGTSIPRALLLPGGAAPVDLPIDILEAGFPGTAVATTDGWLVPVVTFNGTIRVVRLASDGSVLDTYMPDDLTDSLPAVAVTGTTALLAWSGDDLRVHVRQIDLATGTLGSSTVVLGATGSYIESVAITQGVALVTWTQPTGDIAAARVDATTLARVDATDVLVAGGADDVYEPVVAVDGAGVGVVAWTLADTSTNNALRVQYATLSNLAPSPDGGDAGTPPDAGGDGGGGGDDSGGGGGCCEANRPATPLAPVALVALGLLRRRRHRHA